MEIIIEILQSAVSIFREAALYLLFGFIIAGILRIYVRPDIIGDYMNRGRFRSVFFASLIGVPIPI
jgi:uncharacterized protein